MRSKVGVLDRSPARLLLIIFCAAIAALIMMSGCHEWGLDSAETGSGDDGGVEENTAGSVSFSSASYTCAEDAGYVEITVKREGGSEGFIDVLYATIDDTAYAGEDYEATNGTLTWEDGDSADKSFTVAVMDTTPDDDDIAFGIELTDPYGGAVLGSIPIAAVAIGPPEQDVCCLAESKKLASFAQLYDGIARQPVIADELLATALLLTGERGQGPLCCDAQAVRAKTVGNLLESILRQPVMEEDLKAAFLKMSGPAPSSLCCYAKGARIDTVMVLINDVIIRNPDNREKYETLFETYNGLLVVDDMCTEQGTRWMAAAGEILYLYAQYSGDQATLDLIDEVFLTHAGSGPPASIRDRCGIQVGRMAALGNLFQAISRYPTGIALLLEKAEALLGPAIAPPCDRAVAAGYAALGKYYEGMARNPGTDFSGALELMGAPFSAPSCPADQ